MSYFMSYFFVHYTSPIDAVYFLKINKASEGEYIKQYLSFHCPPLTNVGCNSASQKIHTKSIFPYQQYLIHIKEVLILYLIKKENTASIYGTTTENYYVFIHIFDINASDELMQEKMMLKIRK